MWHTKVIMWLLIIAIIFLSESESVYKDAEADTRSDFLFYKESFDESQLDLTHLWHFEGQGKAQIGNGKLALQDEAIGVVLWNRQDFPSDVRLQFDLSFSNNRGIGVFFVAARGLEGEDILKDLPNRTGNYSQYIKGKINNYGFSLHRFYPDGGHNPGTNLRKNSGSHLVNHVEPDPVMNSSHTYHVSIEKDGTNLRMWVDGNLIHDWKDDGKNGAALGGGKIGFRVRGHPSCIMYLDNIVINSL